MRWWWGLLGTKATRQVGFFIVLAHWNNSLWIDMSLHLDTLYWFWANQISILVFGLTQSWLEPTIYRTQGEHATHYTIDVVILKIELIHHDTFIAPYVFLFKLLILVYKEYYMILHNSRFCTFRAKSSKEGSRMFRSNWIMILVVNSIIILKGLLHRWSKRKVRAVLRIGCIENLRLKLENQMRQTNISITIIDIVIFYRYYKYLVENIQRYINLYELKL